MKELLRPILVAVMACLAGGQEGCKPTIPPEASYATETALCVEKASTRAESQACRALVNQKYNLCDTPREDIPCPPK